MRYNKAFTMTARTFYCQKKNKTSMQYHSTTLHDMAESSTSCTPLSLRIKNKLNCDKIVLRRQMLCSRAPAHIETILPPQWQTNASEKSLFCNLFV